jgi:hypothetical protein
MRASTSMARYCATKLEQLVAVESSGTPVTVEPHGDALSEGAERRAVEKDVNKSGFGGRLVVIVVFDLMVVEGQAFVEFGERNREADFG